MIEVGEGRVLEGDCSVEGEREGKGKNEGEAGEEMRRSRDNN